MKCPNCGDKMEKVLGDWVCMECEFHTKNKKKLKGSFR